MPEPHAGSELWLNCLRWEKAGKVSPPYLSLNSLSSAFNASISVLISSHYSQSLFCHPQQQMLSGSKGTNLGRQFPGGLCTLYLHQGQVLLAGMSGGAQSRTVLGRPVCTWEKHALSIVYFIHDYFYPDSSNLKGKAG